MLQRLLDSVLAGLSQRGSWVLREAVMSLARRSPMKSCPNMAIRIVAMSPVP
jgi:hypothetical protein